MFLTLKAQLENVVAQYDAESYQNVITCTANLTQLLINNIDEYSNYYHYEVGRLSALREVESLVKDLLDE